MLVKLRVRSNPFRVLDLDTECRPLSWIAQDYVSKELTAIACYFVDGPRVNAKRMYSWCLGECSMREMLKGFVACYDQADVVTGHFLRAHDLPLLNGALIEAGMPPLADKWTQDTKLDLVRFAGLSKSQKNLGAMFKLFDQKVDMSQEDWREANRLTPKGIAKTRERVVGDVRQHIAMRATLLERGLLGPPRMWRSIGGAGARYTP